MAKEDLPSFLTPEQLAYLEAHLGDNRGPRILAVSYFLIAITVITVILRFVARAVRKLPWQIDDYSMIPALVCRPCTLPPYLTCE